MKSAKVFTRERWRDVPGYEGLYSVSSRGRVKSHGNAKRPHGCMLRCSANRDGYRYATLYSGESGRTSGSKVKVAVLVLTSFVGPSYGRDSCHGDGVSTNDSLRNLSWGTRKQNIADAKRHGTWVNGERNGHAKLSDTQADEIKRSCEAGNVLAARYRVSPATVSMIRNGQRRAV